MKKKPTKLHKSDYASAVMSFYLHQVLEKKI